MSEKCEGTFCYNGGHGSLISGGKRKRGVQENNFKISHLAYIIIIVSNVLLNMCPFLTVIHLHIGTHFIT